MPFASKSAVLNGSVNTLSPAGIEVVVQRGQITALAGDVALNSTGAFLILPAGCVPVGIHLDSDAPLFADVGIVNDAETAVSTAAADGGAVWMAALGANSPTNLSYSRAMARVQPSQVDRKVGIRVTTAGGAGVVGLTLAYRNA